MAKRHGPSSAPQGQFPTLGPKPQQPLVKGGVILPNIQIARTETPFSSETQFFQQETEADRIAEVRLALHGAEIEIQDRIYLAIFGTLNAIRYSFKENDRARVSMALRRKIQDIIEYIDLHPEAEPDNLRNNSIKKAIYDGIEWTEKGIPEPRAVSISNSIFEAVSRVLPPIKRLLPD